MNVKKLEAYKQSQVNKRDNMVDIAVVAVYLGAEPRLYFPKLKDSEGKNIKDENGRDKRAEKATGYTYTLSQYGTSKVVKVVLPDLQELEPLSAWAVTGRGFDMPGMYFIEQGGDIVEY